MGMIWKAMPLLSTLAALVIIAHSAEEGFEEKQMERDYRYELRPRLLDTEAPSYVEPWRAIEAEPMMQDAASNDHQPYEQPIKRRRPRKRKRRPLPSSEEPPQERATYQEETRYMEPEVNQDSTELPRRRRRKPGQGRHSRWTEEFYEFERPLRRRNRRKRPVLDSGPGLSTLALPIENLRDEVRNDNPTEYDDHSNDSQNRGDHVVAEKQNDNAITIPEHYFELSPEIPEDHAGISLTDIYSKKPPTPIYDDKSFSELSMEEFNVNVEKRERLKDDSDLALHFNRTLESGPIDPVTLKEILKKSNGTSLSEILQDRNLSLADLLHGKGNAISAINQKVAKANENKQNNSEDRQIPAINDEIKATQIVTENDKLIKNHTETKEIENKQGILNNNTKAYNESLEAKENGPRIATMRRFPGNANIRRKLRLRPSNSTMTGQLSKDLIAQTARRYVYYNNRNTVKGKDLKNILPIANITQIDKYISKDENIEVPVDIETTTSLAEEITATQTTEAEKEDEGGEYSRPFSATAINFEVDASNEKESDDLPIEIEEVEASNTTLVLKTTTEIITTEKQEVRYKRPVLEENKNGQRRLVFNNNRLKRKQMKQKTTTAEPIEYKQIKDLVVSGDHVSSSEIITRTQKPDAPLPRYNKEDFTSLDDFLTTPIPRRSENVKTTRMSSMAHVTPSRTSSTVWSTTEETAKIEIEEILNDTRTSARLSKILMERNMTLNELVEHRERGSSHVHLADIFHNASKEPNPPEPFLSKSSIEPISRETYPLRALLEANLHDPAVKATVKDTNAPQYIPVVMDFGNNVNENGENMGIMSLLSKITDKANVESSDVKKDSEGTPYISTIINVNASISNSSDKVREGKELKETGMSGWNKLFDLMRRHHENSTGDELPPVWESDDIISEATNMDIKDTDGDGLIILEDLQNYNAFDNLEPKSAEKLDINVYESDTTIQPGILDRLPSSTRSVTVATASIVGLAMVLFLLTYSAFKWKQKRCMLRKKQSFSEERIPTPVFESRKSHKSNCSTRSISPMLSSNIYTLNTMDSRAGTESPEYMWDTLRKPFQ